MSGETKIRVCTAAVRDRLEAIDPPPLPPHPWTDITEVTDEQLTRANVIQVVVSNIVDDEIRYALVDRLRMLGKSGYDFDLDTIEALEARSAKVEEARTAAEEDYWAKVKDRDKKTQRIRKENVQELDAEERDQVLDEAARSFEWQDLADAWDLDPPTPEYLARTDGPAAFYVAARNLTIGATESGKSWLVAIAIKQEIEAHRLAIYFDHENGRATTVSRLRALGLTKEQVKTYLRYRHMEDAPLPPRLASELAEKLYAEGARLVFHDALSPISHSLGLDTSGGDTGAVEEIYKICLDPWAKAGLAACMLDNTPKGNKYDGLGSQHKIAGITGAVLVVVADEKFSRHKAGSSKIYLNKDRGGDAETVMEDDRRLWGVLRVTPDPVKDLDGRTRVVAAVYPPPEPPDPMERLYEEIDRKAATVALARATLVKQGVTSTKSMNQLTDWMGLVQPLDPAFEHAHTDRGYITDVLFTGSSPADLAEAGLRCTSTTYKTSGGSRRRKYLVEVVPMVKPAPATGE
jgi:hypothetical protein